MTEGNVKVSHDQDATQTLISQFTITTLKIPFTTTEISDADRGFVGNLATRRKPIPTNKPNYRRIEGGFEESNISTELE